VRFIASSLFNLRAWQSFCTTSLPLPLTVSCSRKSRNVKLKPIWISWSKRQWVAVGSAWYLFFGKYEIYKGVGIGELAWSEFSIVTLRCLLMVKKLTFREDFNTGSGKIKASGWVFLDWGTFCDFHSVFDTISWVTWKESGPKNLFLLEQLEEEDCEASG